MYDSQLVVYNIKKYFLITQKGYKKKEDRIAELVDRIAELEKFISNKVVELEAMRQTVANKKAIEDDLRDVTKSKLIVEIEYQKVKEQTKVKYACKCTQMHMH